MSRLRLDNQIAIGAKTTEAERPADVSDASGVRTLDGLGNKVENLLWGNADQTFTANDNGTITVSHATNGTDTLKDIDGIWFEGDAEWHGLDELV